MLSPSLGIAFSIIMKPEVSERSEVGSLGTETGLVGSGLCRNKPIVIGALEVVSSLWLLAPRLQADLEVSWRNR